MKDMIFMGRQVDMGIKMLYLSLFVLSAWIFIVAPSGLFSGHFRPCDDNINMYLRPFQSNFMAES